ncbi:hypothetical protein EUX98_g2755 [Antrodiella citrinella]|uniref:Uncharacterized protein n=1 Tax=Antrodiella citrinella TaxID=2447956 RepID=A0A4S4MYA0_9APHY|nr:hypothetical protein EUX98_g2755 [Antrodiella citrinella]
MYIRHGTAFMTGALYADSQAIVKSIIINILRFQQLNPHLPFYCILEGTDLLEAVFGDVRTQNHARNRDILQISEKLSIAAAIQTIFARNPDIDRGHQRLSLKNADETHGSLVPDTPIGDHFSIIPRHFGPLRVDSTIRRTLPIRFYDASDLFESMRTTTRSRSVLLPVVSLPNSGRPSYSDPRKPPAQ